MSRRAVSLGGTQGHDISTSGLRVGADQERELQSAREAPSVRGADPIREGAGTRPGTDVAGRGRPGQGVTTPWFLGAENPLAMMRRIQDDLDGVFRAFGIPRLGAAFAAPRGELEALLASSPTLTQSAHWSPQIEVLERDDGLVIRADLPGVKRDDVELNVDNGVLTIRGQRRHEHTETDRGYRRTERSYGTFFRQIPLPDGVESDQIEASYEDGVLEVTIPSPRDQQRGRRRIEIR